MNSYSRSPIVVSPHSMMLKKKPAKTANATIESPISKPSSTMGDPFLPKNKYLIRFRFMVFFNFYTLIGIEVNLNCD